MQFEAVASSQYRTMATPAFAAIGTGVALNDASDEVNVADAVAVELVMLMIWKLLVPAADTTAAPESRSVYPTRRAKPPAEHVPPEPTAVLDKVA